MFGKNKRVLARVEELLEDMQGLQIPVALRRIKVQLDELTAKVNAQTRLLESLDFTQLETIINQLKEIDMSELGNRLSAAVDVLKARIDEAQERVIAKVAEEDAAQDLLVAEVAAKQAMIDELNALIEVLRANPTAEEVAAAIAGLEAAIADVESTLPAPPVEEPPVE